MVKLYNSELVGQLPELTPGNPTAADSVGVVSEAPVLAIVSDKPTLAVSQKVKITPYLTVGKGKDKYNVDSTVFFPNTSSMYGSGSFKERYEKQINSVLFNNNEDINPGDLLSLMLLFNALKLGKTPIQIIGNVGMKYKIDMVQVLNKYFSVNYKILSSVHDSLESSSRLGAPNV